MMVACHSHGLVTVPVSSSASSSHLSHVIEKTSLKLLVTDPDALGRVLSLARGSTLKHIVVLGEASSEDQKQAQDAGIEVNSISDVEAKGKTVNFKDVTVGKCWISIPK
jgi:long-subunit acyl-CoA synthetase (AMP-forming)